jgi:hypothetical protein
MTAVTLEFSSPLGALLALGAAVPLTAYFAVSKRAASVRRALRLPDLTLDKKLLPVVAATALAGLLGLAAAQPVLERASERRARADVEVIVVVDNSRSMLAQRTADSPTRMVRAKAAALELRHALPQIPVGLASMTNRVLPHVFPTADGHVFDATLERAIDVHLPPPASGFILTPEQQSVRNATSLSQLSAVARQRFYAPASRRRLLVVLTDGESLNVAPQAVGQALREAGIQTILLHFWAANERVFTNGRPERQYLPVAGSRKILETLAAATGGSVYDETEIDAAARSARELLGDGPTRVEKDEHGRPLSLASYLAVIAFLPLAFLLWRRDR